MNTTINFANSHLENSDALVPTLDQSMNQNEYASASARFSASPQPTRKWSSGRAGSGWADAWTLRGIPELDSPMAG